MRVTIGVGLAAVLTGLAACSGGAAAGPGQQAPPEAGLSDAAGADALLDVATDGSTDAPPEAAFVPLVVPGYAATHAAFPLVRTAGGPVMDAPRVVPIFFASDSLQADIERFFGQLSGSDYWTATTSEYGVGSLSLAPSIVVSDSPPTSSTETDVANFLGSYLDGTHAEWPQPDDNNIYTIFYPEQTTLTTPDGTSCLQFGGYHDEGNIKTGPHPAFTYAIIPRCPTAHSAIAGFGAIDAVTTSTSHEIVEAATDPLYRSAPAYLGVDLTHGVWSQPPTGPGEVGDMCLSEGPSSAYRRLVGTFMVQRTWSNRAARASLDPCVPALASVYFNAAPDFAMTLPYGTGPGAPVTPGIAIPVGHSATVGVQLFADAPTANWYVDAAEVIAAGGGPLTLQFSWDTRSGNNGDVLMLTITRIANGAGGGTGIIVHSSTAPSIAFSSVGWNGWLGFIGN